MPSNRVGTKVTHFVSTFTAAQFSGTNKKGNFLVCKLAPTLSSSIFEAHEHSLLLFLIRGQRKGDI